MYDSFQNLNIFRKIVVDIPVVVLEDPNMNGFTFVETGMLKVLPDGGRVVAADVVTVDVGKESDERVKEGVNEAVVAEEPEGMPKVNDALEGIEDDNTKGCCSKAFVEQITELFVIYIF